MIKLVITDVDETIVKEGSTELNPEFFDVIRELTDKGIEFVAASGRHISSLSLAFAPVADRIWFLAQNGSFIKKGDREIIPNPVPYEYVKEFWAELKNMQAPGGIAYSATTCFVPFEGDQMYRWLDEGYRFTLKAMGGWNPPPEDETYVMLTMYHPEDCESFATANLDPKWRSRAQVLAAGKTWVDLVPFGNGKGPALERLCKELSIEPSEVIAFGDNMNDLSMIEFAGTGIAVENAKPAVKAAADRIVPDYTKSGVLNELKKLL